MNVYLKTYTTSVETSPKVVYTGDKESCRNFIGNYAYENNYGIYRYWYSELENKYYFDCGPQTFYTTEDIELALKDSSESI